MVALREFGRVSAELMGALKSAPVQVPPVSLGARAHHWVP